MVTSPSQRRSGQGSPLLGSAIALLTLGLAVSCGAPPAFAQGGDDEVQVEPMCLAVPSTAQAFELCAGLCERELVGSVVIPRRFAGYREVPCAEFLRVVRELEAKTDGVPRNQQR